MFTEHLLHVRYSFKAREVNILVLRGYLRAEEENQGALKGPEGSSQWLWALVSISVKEEGWTAGIPGPFPTSHHGFAPRSCRTKFPFGHQNPRSNGENWHRKVNFGIRVWLSKRKLCTSCRPIPNACKVVRGIESLLPLVRDGAGGGRDTCWPQ